MSKEEPKTMEELGNFTMSDKWATSEHKAMFSRYGIGEVIRVQFHGKEGGVLVGIVKRVIFESMKVRYDVQTLNGGIFEGIYSNRILPLDDEWLEVLNRKENKDWVSKVRKEMCEIR